MALECAVSPGLHLEYRAPSCPWRSFEDPLVIAVSQLYDLVRREDFGVDVGTLRALNPRHLLWQGTIFYAEVLKKCINKRREQERSMREAQARAEVASRGRR